MKGEGGRALGGAGSRYLAVIALHVVLSRDRQAPPGLLRDQVLGFAESLPGWLLAVVGVFLQRGGSLAILFFVCAQHICLLAFFNFLLFGRQPRGWRAAWLSLLFATCIGG